MPHIDIASFSEGDNIEGFYAVREAALHMTSTGKPYIRLSVADASGVITGNMWDAGKELFSTFSAGSVVKLQAQVETYRGAPQLKIFRLRAAGPEEADPSAFVATTKADMTELRAQLAEAVASLRDPDYAAIARSFFDDPQVLAKFCRSPAAKENHHAYIGGLLEHTVSLARYADLFAQTSPARLNRDLLICGTLLHDIGKIEELSVGAVIDYTDKGSLLGHLIIGAMMVEERGKNMPGLPEIKKELVQHLILSHHGKFEYGSPVLPKTPEALALHHIDNLDAKTVAARRLIDEDDSQSGWTQRSWMLETKLYKDSTGTSAGVEEEMEIAGSAAKAPKPEAQPAKKPGRGRDAPAAEAPGSLF